MSENGWKCVDRAVNGWKWLKIAGHGKDNDDKINDDYGKESNWMALSQFYCVLWYLILCYTWSEGYQNCDESNYHDDHETFADGQHSILVTQLEEENNQAVGTVELNKWSNKLFPSLC